MSSPKFSPPAVPSDYAKALKYADALREHVRSLRAQLDKVIRERDGAESAARSLTLELQVARREIAELRSLAPHQKGN